MKNAKGRYVGIDEVMDWGTGQRLEMRELNMWIGNSYMYVLAILHHFPLSSTCISPSTGQTQRVSVYSAVINYA